MTLRKGSCHCGAVAFEAAVDLSADTSRCNCSICTKTRFWKAPVTADRFRVVRGEEELTAYEFGSGTITHFFCRTCGVKPFGRAYLAELGGAFYAVNVACLDDATPEELAAAPITFEDGRNDDWARAPEHTGYL